MRNRSKSFLWFAIMGCAASCGYTAPARDSGPAVSKEGVQVTLVGERCYVNRSAETFPTTVNDDQLSLALRVQIANRASHTAILSLSDFRLSDSAVGAPTRMAPRNSASLSLVPGSTAVVSLDFQQTGDLDCRHEMALDADGAITIAGGQVRVEPIRFLASD